MSPKSAPDAAFSDAAEWSDYRRRRLRGDVRKRGPGTLLDERPEPLATTTPTSIGNLRQGRRSPGAWPPHPARVPDDAESAEYSGIRSCSPELLDALACKTLQSPYRCRADIETHLHIKDTREESEGQ